MDREIKFRAWDHFNQTMWKQNGLGNFFTSIERFNKITLMQFTGLYDKNGKEIYEGDILGGFPHGNAIVKWNIEYACFESITFYETVDEAGQSSTEEIKSLLANELKSCYDSWQVIGNIFENPNLLQNG